MKRLLVLLMLICSSAFAKETIEIDNISYKRVDVRNIKTYDTNGIGNLFSTLKISLFDFGPKGHKRSNRIQDTIKRSFSEKNCNSEQIKVVQIYKEVHTFKVRHEGSYYRCYKSTYIKD